MMRNYIYVLPIVALCAVACGDDGGSSEASNSSSASVGGMNGSGGSGGVGGVGGAGGMPEQVVNGCTISMAEDKTDQAVVPISWDLPHQSCIIVRVNQEASWIAANGTSFAEHPLAGGVVVDGTPTKDPTAPASTVDQSGQVAMQVYTEPGVYPYYCETHLSSMQGVVYVVEAGAGGAGGGTGGAGGN